MFNLKTLLKVTVIVGSGLLAFFVPITTPFVAFIVPALCEIIDATFQEGDTRNILMQDEATGTENIEDSDSHEMSSSHITIGVDDEIELSGYILLEE